MNKRRLTSAATAVVLAGGALIGGPIASATTTGGHLWVANQLDSLALTGPIAAGSTPSIGTPTPSTADAYQIVFEGVDGDLFTAGPSGSSDLHVAMADGTSPSLVEMKNGGWEAYYQSNTSHLALAGTLGDAVSRFAMAPGTSPAVVDTPEGVDNFQLVWQGSDGNLWVDGPIGPNHASEIIDTDMAMMAGTSPSVTELGSNFAYDVAYEGANGDLWIYGSNNPGDTHKTMATGTSPAVIAFSTGFLIAYHGTDGNLITYAEPGENEVQPGAQDWYWPMVPGTNPSLVNVGGLAYINFQMADTSRAPFGQVMTFLPFDNAGQEELVNDEAAAATTSSTSIAELRDGGYATAFQTTS